MSAGAPVTDGLIFPIGQYLGPFYQAGVDAPLSHRLRVGYGLANLEPGAEAAIWASAHGQPPVASATGMPWSADAPQQAPAHPGEGGPGRPWTAAAVTRAVLRAGWDDVTPALARLHDDGIVTTVAPDTGAAVEFARRHRVSSLMVGLGSDRSPPGRFVVGRPGAPVAALSWLPYEVWRWGQIAHSLWDVCEVLAKLLSAEADRPDAAPRPEGAVMAVLSDLHQLLRINAVFLDTVHTPDMTSDA